MWYFIWFLIGWVSAALVTRILQNRFYSFAWKSANIIMKLTQGFKEDGVPYITPTLLMKSGLTPKQTFLGIFYILKYTDCEMYHPVVGYKDNYYRINLDGAREIIKEIINIKTGNIKLNLGNDEYVVIDPTEAIFCLEIKYS